ncbi:4-cresol dehydrogenase [hydroxylating] flavoprotein subunit [mine drainage metagenome]|uniref:4-cresol dehydrogenase [hydroxylating] flavoprotein subunit n=1 Tax=mine drainage metagenome TaxID=410659 RepID=A0A1J5RKH9_9ZZZZ
MDFDHALRDWAVLLGQSRVLDAAAAQAGYGSCTTGIKRRLAGALRPHERAQIPEVVAIAARFKVPLYPISTGHNWGYGTALPATDDCVILDLSGLDRIVDFDPGNGLLTVEPGVTQGQLANFLDQGGHPYLVPVTGAGPSCSLIGNALERGYGITPHADHFAAVMTLEAVLPDGRVYRSALSGMNGEPLDRAFKWGIGPYLDGIFSQSGFGIVTEMSIALARRPDGIKAFLFGLKRAEQLGELVERVREVLARYPGVVGGINLMNAHRVLAMAVPYPGDRLGADGLVPAGLLSELSRDNQVNPWTGFGTLYGSSGVVAAAQREIRALLKPLASRLIFVGPSGARTLARLGRLLPGRYRSKFARSLEMLERSLQLVAGRPNETALPLCYWLSGKRAPDDAAMDPARDACGVIWYAPLVPMQPERVAAYLRMVTAIMREYRLEPLITLTSVSERCFDSTVPLLFNLDSEQSRENAGRCYWALLEAGRSQGFLPYRVGIQTMSWLSANDTTYWQLVREIKKTLDPDAILSPGRYV